MSLRKLRAVIVFFALVPMLSACSHSPSRDHATAPYFDAAFYDHNRAPASLQPPTNVSDVNDPLDPLHMQAMADYNYALGEAQSMEGQTQKAIESFKTVLVYDEKSAQVRIRLAAEYVRAGSLTEALEQSEIAVQKDPKNVDARLLLGGLYTTLKSYKKALSQYEEVIKIDPENTDAPLYVGAVYAEQQQYDKAVKYFEALAKNPSFENKHVAYYYIGRVRAEQDGKAQKKAAEAAFKRALQTKPDHLESLMALGALYLEMGQEQLATDLYAKFQKEHGPSLRVAEILSKIYKEQEKYDLAYEQFEILERSEDDALTSKLNMALIWIEKKNYQAAVTKLLEILNQVPDSDKIRFYLAAVYEEMGETEDAVDQFLKIPSSSSFYGESIVHAAYMLKQKQKLDKALDVVEDGLKARKDLPQLFAIQASLYDEKGQFAKAADALKSGVERFPENVQLHFFLGTITDRMGNKEGSIEHMKKVIDLDPNHVQGLNYLAYVYAELGKELDEAERLVRRALELEPKDAFIIDTHGWVLYKKGDYREAVKVLETAYKLLPNEVVIAEHLGDAYLRLQMNEKARVMYQRAAELEIDEKRIDLIRNKLSAVEKQLTSPLRQPASMPAGK